MSVSEIPVPGRPPAEPPAPSPSPRWRFRVLLVVAAVVSVGVLYGVWTFEVRRIVGVSMWPVLENDDWILVKKQGLAEPKRWEVWVADLEKVYVPRHHHALKRVLGLPGDWIDFAAGDLFVGPDGDALQRVQRSPALIEAMRVPVFSVEGRPEEAESFLVAGGRVVGGEGGLSMVVSDGGAGMVASLLGGGPPGASGIFDRHRDPDQKWVVGERQVPDVRVVADVPVIAGQGTFRIRHRLYHDYRPGSLPVEEARIVELGPRGLRVLRIDPRAGVEVLLDDPAFRAPAQVRMETLDGLFTVEVAEARPKGRRLTLKQPRDTVWLVSEDPKTGSPASRSELLFELDQGRVTLARLDISRDVYYFWPPILTSAKQVRANQVFLVGDNPPESRDSRDYLGVDREDLIGRAIRVLSPRRRAIP